MRYLVTGGAGFVGSHIVDRLVAQGHDVVVIDNLSHGRMEFLEGVKERITFIRGDLLDEKILSSAVEGCDFVFHMAANADVKENLTEPTKCLYQNTVATSNLLEAMRKAGVRRIAFASTGSIYGEPDLHPTPEDAPFPTQTSMYGASKLGCEGLLEAYAVGFGFQVYIFRFVSLMGERYTHGCVFDFSKKLLKNPRRLEILGNGKQQKSYLYVKDCVDAMFTSIAASKELITICNIGHDAYIDVTAIAQIVCDELGLREVEFVYTGGERGWVGDSPFIYLDIKRIKALGWSPKVSIQDSVRTTVRWIQQNQWILHHG
jgi:UDP-glucose 4-epimerase